MEWCDIGTLILKNLSEKQVSRKQVQGISQWLE